MEKKCCPKCIIDLDYKPAQCNNGECECHQPAMEKIEELGTGLPIGMVAELDDHNPMVEVDWNFIRLTLQAMNSLKKVAPDHITEASIPMAKEYAHKLYKSLATPPTPERREDELCPKCGYLVVLNCCRCVEYHGDGNFTPERSGEWEEEFDDEVWPTDGTFSLGSNYHAKKIKSFIRHTIERERQKVIKEIIERAEKEDLWLGDDYHAENLKAWLLTTPSQ